MPRHERLNYPGCIYHVITRGIERQKIFRDNQDRDEFLSRLEKALEEADDVSRAKNLISFWANRELGISGKEIADYFGVSSPAISYSIKQGEKYVRQNDVNLLF